MTVMGIFRLAMYMSEFFEEIFIMVSRTSMQNSNIRLECVV